MKERSIRTLLLATGNSGKVRELQQMFADLPFEIRSLRDFSGIRDVPETGSTFVENASLKAAGFALQTGQFALADDSGLEVTALDGQPGIHSARFAGPETGYDIKIDTLFQMMKASGNDDRSARFVCAMAIADDRGEVIHTVQAECSGRIADEARGSNGFGYDPIFIPDEFDRTFGELDDHVKRAISHRSKAAELIIRYLLDFIA